MVNLLLTLLFAFTSAPFPINTLQVSLWPFPAAICNGVHKSWAGEIQELRWVNPLFESALVIPFTLLVHTISHFHNLQILGESTTLSQCTTTTREPTTTKSSLRTCGCKYSVYPRATTQQTVLEAPRTEVLLWFEHQQLSPSSSTADHNAMEILDTGPNIHGLLCLKTRSIVFTEQADGEKPYPAGASL